MGTLIVSVQLKFACIGYTVMCTLPSLQTVERRITSLMKSYRALAKFSKKTKGYLKQCNEFIQKQHQLFDMIADQNHMKTQERLWGVKMTPEDQTFFENQQLSLLVGYCTSFVDRRRELSKKRKIDSLNRPRNEYSEFEVLSTNNTHDLSESEIIDPDYNEEQSSLIKKAKI